MPEPIVLHTLRDRKKGMLASWSDDDLGREHNVETANHVMTFTDRCESDEESYVKFVSYEELDDSYKNLYVKCEDICQV